MNNIFKSFLNLNFIFKRRPFLNKLEFPTPNYIQRNN